ncbi:heme-binding protein [Tunturiibacter empetritectus]|uniref:heme-binding protein n=1 Tax=Tunturiibacter empetritectus TaxID=3069691 RepID=UPI003D9BB72F
MSSSNRPATVCKQEGSAAHAHPRRPRRHRLARRPNSASPPSTTTPPGVSAKASASLAVSRNQSLVIDIRRFGQPHQPLFYTALAGTTPDNPRWVQRKSNVVARFHRSSYAIGLALEQSSRTFSERYNLPDADFAAHGGSFPSTSPSQASSAASPSPACRSAKTTISSSKHSASNSSRTTTPCASHNRTSHAAMLQQLQCSNKVLSAKRAPREHRSHVGSVIRHHPNTLLRVPHGVPSSLRPPNLALAPHGRRRAHALRRLPYGPRHGPYRDIVDPNMPTTLLIEGAVMHLFGGNSLTWRLFDLSLLGISAIAMFVICKPYSRFAALFAASLFALIHGRDGLVELGQRDLTMTVCLLIGYAFLFTGLRTDPAAHPKKIQSPG